MQAVEQGSQDWHSWRMKGIGGSDCPIIMGFHDFGTPYQLWLEKTGQLKRAPNEFIVQKGLMLEPKARAAYSLMNDLDMPAALVQHPQIPWLIASLDGFDYDSRLILEIKYQGREAHENVKKGIIPTKYLAQMNHQMCAAESDQADFLSCIEVGEGENKSVSIEVVRVHRDDLFIKRMIEAETAFYELIQKRIPPEFVAEDFKHIRAKGMKRLFEEYAKIRSEIEAILPDEPRMRFGEVLISKNKDSLSFRIDKKK